ncbi:hypothetical protein MMC21_006576 [Puttea exsequens]|nr:hypothetical protein [Puttea exsequens]
MAKSRPPHSACTGADIEMVTPGGEVAFVGRMIDESKALGDRCQWFTSMLGKYLSVEVIVEWLRESGVDNWAVRDLVQGNKTRRWAVAWSWGAMRPSLAVARGTSTLPKHLLPFPSEATLAIPNFPLGACSMKLNSILQDLDLRWWYKPISAIGVGFASGNIWSRAARRKACSSPGASDGPSVNKDNTAGEYDEESAFGFRVQVARNEQGGTEVLVRWLRGTNSVLFESFCGMLKGRLTASS